MTAIGTGLAVGSIGFARFGTEGAGQAASATIPIKQIPVRLVVLLIISAALAHLTAAPTCYHAAYTASSLAGPSPFGDVVVDGATHAAERPDKFAEDRDGWRVERWWGVDGAAGYLDVDKPSAVARRETAITAG